MMNLTTHLVLQIVEFSVVLTYIDAISIVFCKKNVCVSLKIIGIVITVMVLFTVGGFGPTISACICMEDGFSKPHLKNFLFNSSGKNWAFLFVALFLETVVFGGSSAGIISSIPRTPVAVIVVLVVFLQASIVASIKTEYKKK